MITSQSLFFCLFFTLLTFGCTGSGSPESTEENSTVDEESSESEKWNDYFDLLVKKIVSKSCCCPTCNKYLDNGKQKILINKISIVLQDHINQLLKFRFWPLFQHIFHHNELFLNQYENCLNNITEQFVHFFITEHTKRMKKEVQNRFGNYLVDGTMKIPTKQEKEKYEEYQEKHLLFIIANQSITTRLLCDTFHEINAYITEIVSALSPAQENENTIKNRKKLIYKSSQ
jgi:hypothetical protein